MTKGRAHSSLEHRQGKTLYYSLPERRLSERRLSERRNILVEMSYVNHSQ